MRNAMKSPRSFAYCNPVQFSSCYDRLDLQKKPRVISPGADRRQFYATPQKIPCLQAVCARRLGQPPACDSEPSAISTSDPGDPAIAGTSSLPSGLVNPAHSANRGEDAFWALPIGFAHGICCSTDPSYATGRISEPWPAGGCSRFAPYSARCRARRTPDPYS